MIGFQIIISILVTTSTIWIKNLNKTVRNTEKKEVAYDGMLKTVNEKIAGHDVIINKHNGEIGELKNKVGEIIITHNHKHPQETIKELEW